MKPRGDILFFLCLNDKGGAEISMIRLAQGLLAKGHSIKIAVYGKHPELAKELGFKGDVIDFSCTRTTDAFLPLFRLLRRASFRALISALTHTNIIALIAAKLASRSLKVIVSEHGMDGLEACYQSKAFGTLTQFLYARAASVVAVSQGLTRCWRVFLPKKAKVLTIYNPVISEERQQVPSAHPWLQETEFPVVMGIGRLQDEKNFSLLIKAFERVVKIKPCRLIILGEGGERASLETLVQKLSLQDKVLMPGFVEEINAWLPYASLLVCPSKKEGFGNVIVEALNNGICVVSTDCPLGPSEILEQGRYGRLVPVNDVDAMAEAILAALSEKTDKSNLQMRAASFTVMRCIDDYAALVDKVSI